MRTGRRLTIVEHGGVSPYTFEARDGRGRYFLVWFLDYEALIPTLPRVMNVAAWQIINGRADMLDVAVSGGSPGLGA